MLSLSLCLVATSLFTNCKNDDDESTPEQPSATQGIYINEVCSSGTDWVEIYNSTDKDVALGGFKLQDDKGTDEEYTFKSDAKIPAKGFLVLEKEKEFEFGISSKGDIIKLLDPQRKIIDEVTVPELDENATYARKTDGGTEWTVTANGTKGNSNAGGADEPNPTTPSSLKGIIMINEVYTFSDQSDIKDLDYIELYNASDKSVDLSGIKVWEGGGLTEAWTMPEGKNIPAKGYLVIECDKENLHNDKVNYPSWGLSKNDETIVIADNQMNIIDEVKTPNMSEGETYGRKTDGSNEWVIFTELTKGKSNNGAKEKTEIVNNVGVYVNEVFTNNQDVKSKDWDDTKDFVELYNATDKDVDLSGFSLNDDAMKEEKRYIIPEGTVIKAKSFLTFDVYKGNTNGPVFGLGKGGDKVFLYDKNKNTVDEITTPEFADNEVYSLGRKTDGGSEVVVFTEVSKNASNNGHATK